ncbi:MAG: hypothetical protein QOI16_3715, partial [Pseudonocardiales bacterium]|nr:hypothetical protein [Pseudonocardiales bacterium]
MPMTATASTSAARAIFGSRGR